MLKLDLHGGARSCHPRKKRNVGARPRAEPLGTEPALPAGMGRWERRDANRIKMRTTTKGGPPWAAVKRRIVFISGLMVLDEEVREKNREDGDRWQLPVTEELRNLARKNGGEAIAVLRHTVETAL